MDLLSEHRIFIAALQKKVKNGDWLNSPSEKSEMSHIMGQKNYKSCISSLNIKKLNNVLQISPDEKYILVEPGITMEALVDACLIEGLIPPVVPEFKGITVGGAISGAAIESSSHRYGQFNDICLSYEILTADGDLLQLSPNEHSELFYAFAGSYGTLGILLSVKIQLINQPPWMRLTYRRFQDHTTAVDFLAELHQSKSPPEVMEAIVFPKKTVVIFGSSTKNLQNLPKTSISRYWDNWFYSHVDQIQEEHYTDSLKVRDYLFRHDRGAFWMGGYSLYPRMLFCYFANKIYKIQPKFCIPKNPGLLSRLFFGGLTGSFTLYKSLHRNGEHWFRKNFVIQDFYLPKNGTNIFITDVLNRCKITPLWICPVKSTKTGQLFSPHQRKSEELLFDVGVYGISASGKGEDDIKYLENLTHSLNGRKMFYCATYISLKQFWALYPEQTYRNLRKEYGAEMIPDITEKVLIP